MNPKDVATRMTRMRSGRKPPKSLQGGCLTLFGLPFLLAGLALSLFYFSGYLKSWQTGHWVEVPCWIDSTELETNHGSDSTTYKVLASYHYVYGGNEYNGERVSFGIGSDNVGDFQQRVHRELSSYAGNGKGAGASARPFRCYVNPEKPAEAVLYRDLRWQMQAFLAIFALTFPAVGAGIVAAGLMGGRVARREERLAIDHPEEPWRWREIWSKPAIPEEGGPWWNALGLYTLWSAAIILPLILSTAESGAFRTERSSWLLSIFVILWLIPAWFTWRGIVKRRTFGRAELELAEMPVRPGGRLAGNILLGRPLPMHGGCELMLSCSKLTTRNTGDGTSTTTELIWQGAESLSNDMISRDLSGYRMPVSIAVPVDAPPSGPSGTFSGKHLWKLRFQLSQGKVATTFEIPVFNTGVAPEPTIGETRPSLRDVASFDLPIRLAGRGIRSEFTPSGTPVSLLTPAGNNRGVIFFLILFNLIWTGVAVALIRSHAPVLFQIIWVFSAAVIWVSVIYQLIHSRKVTFGNLDLELVNRWGSVSRGILVSKSEIARFLHGAGGSTNNTQFYQVRLEDVHGRKRTLVNNITEETTAEELVRRLETWKNG